jgi:hypothetical protein
MVRSNLKLHPLESDRIFNLQLLSELVGDKGLLKYGTTPAYQCLMAYPISFDQLSG